VWNDLLGHLREVLSAALDRPSARPLQEDYLIATVHSFAAPVTAEELLDAADLVPLLSGEERPLSDGARRDLLAQRFSYHPDDLAVITWDRAFILEPRHESDVEDVLEMANAQLLEMRTYDEMLDDELPRMHELAQAARRRTHFLASRRYARLAGRLYALVAEVTELAERVDNALQVTEDVYLARVYAAAMNLFRVPNVSAAVDRKLEIIRQTYTALHGEAAGGRAEVLEVAILALIALEIVLSGAALMPALRCRPAACGSRSIAAHARWAVSERRSSRAGSWLTCQSMYLFQKTSRPPRRPVAAMVRTH
jgi:hypothetical protein